MAVAIDLPPNTDVVDDVVAVGMPAENTDGAALITTLIESHRFSDGVAFIPPGTPTNNLANSASGYSPSNVPAPPEPLVAPAPETDAARLAAAWGIDPMELAPIDAAASRALDEARLMGRALFEATWGSYLRQQAQPGFDLNLLPLAFAHVTSFVRGGGPLPVIRLGRQPYAIAPVMARGTWAAMTANAFEQWLANFLPGIRPLWTSGSANVPTGPDLFAFQPVSTRVRLRSANVGSADRLHDRREGSHRERQSRRQPPRNPGRDRLHRHNAVGLHAALPARTGPSCGCRWSADTIRSSIFCRPRRRKPTVCLGCCCATQRSRSSPTRPKNSPGSTRGRQATAVARTAPTVTVANLRPPPAGASATLPGFTTQATDTSQQTLAAGAGKDVDGTTSRSRIG